MAGAHVDTCWRTPRSSSPTYSLHSHGTPVSSCRTEVQQGSGSVWQTTMAQQCHAPCLCSPSRL